MIFINSIMIKQIKTSCFNRSSLFFKFLCILFFTIYGFIASQNIRYTNFGIKVGVNRTEIIGFESNDSKTGFVGIQVFGGLSMQTKIGKKLFLENEFLFSYTDDYHFIEIPLELKYIIFEKFYLKLGPKLDFIVDNEQENSSYYYFKTFGISLYSGLEYDIFKNIFIELNFSKGFTEQVNDKILDINNGKRNVLRLAIGYKF